MFQSGVARLSIQAIRTSPAAPATMAGNAWATPLGARETSVLLDHVSPPSVDFAKNIRSGPLSTVAAFQSAYSVPAASEVMVEHCRRSGAGVWVRDGAELITATRRLLADPELGRTLGHRGRAYVEAEYALAAYERRLLEIFPVDR